MKVEPSNHIHDLMPISNGFDSLSAHLNEYLLALGAAILVIFSTKTVLQYLDAKIEDYEVVFIARRHIVCAQFLHSNDRVS